MELLGRPARSWPGKGAASIVGAMAVIGPPWFALQRWRADGFDSFKGLSDPDPDRDVSFWKQGMYACSREQVEQLISARTKPRIKLIEGFFSESLSRAGARELGRVCFARIGCDIYEPALQCLHFLSDRLADSAILVFDDWAFWPEFGETRAFFEWVAGIDLKFEYLVSGPRGHLHLRVRRR